MNRDRRADDARGTGRRYVRCVRWTKWVTRAGQGTVLDVSLAITAIGLTAIAVWGGRDLIGTVVIGPSWLLAVLPLLIGAPLAFRRRAPLLMWTVQWSGIALEALITQHSPAGLELMFALFVGAYSLAVYSSLRHGIAGLAVMAVGAAIYIMGSRAMGGGNLLFIAHGTGVSGQSRDTGLVFLCEILTCMLLGVFVHARREAAALAERNTALQRQAERALAAERTRIARELHDIVAHHLSVVVLQAAGAQASGKAPGAALEKIEHSGRQALTEMRRLLGVLREPAESAELREPAGSAELREPAEQAEQAEVAEVAERAERAEVAERAREAGLAPQPGVAELAALAESVRAAGLPVRLAVDGDHQALPAAVDVSAYRIVQEALTNVLKHAGATRADVTVGCAGGAVTIEVTDDGGGGPAEEPRAGGHGLAGMRERAALFGGELRAGPRPGGGFAVRARLPLGDEPS
jgi:signal transduction histidine kinase